MFKFAKVSLKLEHACPRTGFGMQYELKDFILVNEDGERNTIEDFINNLAYTIEDLQVSVESLQSQINTLER